MHTHMHIQLTTVLRSACMLALRHSRDTLMVKSQRSHVFNIPKTFSNAFPYSPSVYVCVRSYMLVCVCM